MRNRMFALATVAVLALGATACSSDSPTGGNNPPPPPPPPAPPPGTVIVNLTAGLRFDPAEVSIAAGTTIRWVNQGGGHTVTPRDGGQNGVWAREVINAGGQTFEHTFNVGGQTYDYFCEPHELQGMTGRVIVQ